jgi:hypothetical protein
MSAPDESPAAEHDRLRTDLAGYVLGGLSVDEQVAVEAHLTECESCRAELAQLEPIPVLLDLALDADTATALPEDAGIPAAPEPAAAALAPPPPAFRPAPSSSASVVGAADARRHRLRRGRTSRRLLASAAALVVVVGSFAVGYLAAPGAEGFGPRYALHAVGGSGASGTAAMRVESYGTEVHLDLKGLHGGPGTYYECLWWSGNGVRTAGTFKAADRDRTEVDLVTVPDHRGDWTLQVVEHRAGAKTGVPVLQSQT